MRCMVVEQTWFIFFMLVLFFFQVLKSLHNFPQVATFFSKMCLRCEWAGRERNHSEVSVAFLCFIVDTKKSIHEYFSVAFFKHFFLSLCAEFLGEFSHSTWNQTEIHKNNFQFGSLFCVLRCLAVCIEVPIQQCTNTQFAIKNIATWKESERVSFLTSRAHHQTRGWQCRWTCPSASVTRTCQPSASPACAPSGWSGWTCPPPGCTLPSSPSGSGTAL